MPRPTYTEEQVYQIYDRINLPKQHRHRPGEASKAIARSNDGLAYLSTLQRHHLASVPFENLELHYSPTKVITTDHELLFQKIVTQGTGRGGYCMENNLFFATFLRTLGFQIMSTGGRVNNSKQPDSAGVVPETFTGWSHMINIVTVQNARYMVDVGFGTGQSTHPLLLKDRQPSLNIAPSQLVRLRWDAPAENEDQGSKLWIFERQDTPEGPWIPTYCFPDGIEFLPADYMVANHFTSTHRSSFFTYKVVCSKFVLDDAGEEIVGTVVVFGNSVHRRIKGVKEDLGPIEKEEDRIGILDRHLGVKLSEHQKAGIRGMVSAV